MISGKLKQLPQAARPSHRFDASDTLRQALVTFGGAAINRSSL